MTDRERPEQTPPDGVLARQKSSQDEREIDEAVDLLRPARRPPKPPPKRRPRRLGFFIVLLLILVPGMWWTMNRSFDDTPPVDFSGGVDSPVDETVKAGDRAVVLVFPEWDASGYVTEQRQIPSRDRPGEDLFGVMTVLCEGPNISGAISGLPRGTRALAAFVNPDDNSAVLDFSQELVTRHPGGSAAEVATLTSILRTVALNFPRTRSCVILVDGAQVETIGGHLDLVRSFDPRRWL